MALLAPYTKLPIMNIFTLVARNAIATYRGCIFTFWCFIFVTAFTSHLTMRTIQHILGLFVVIEIPQLPRSGVMAVLTAFTQFELVLIFPLVASVAFLRGILVTSCLVAALASGGDVPAGQWKFCQTMVKLLNFPVFVGVTRSTLFASLAFVLVVFFVAAVTIRCGFAVAGQIFVARNTLQYAFGVCVA